MAGTARRTRPVVEVTRVLRNDVRRGSAAPPVPAARGGRSGRGRGAASRGGRGRPASQPVPASGAARGGRERGDGSGGGRGGLAAAQLVPARSARGGRGGGGRGTASRGGRGQPATTQAVPTTGASSRGGGGRGNARGRPAAAQPVAATSARGTGRGAASRGGGRGTASRGASATSTARGGAVPIIDDRQNWLMGIAIQRVIAGALQLPYNNWRSILNQNARNQPIRPIVIDLEDSDSEDDVDDDAEEEENKNALRTDMFGACTVCAEDEVTDPVGCLHCRSCIGCRKCATRWYSTSKRNNRQKIASCPLCRHQWAAAAPEVGDMLDLVKTH